MNTLIVIPARGGSKGIPGKNGKLLGGKPLLHYTLDLVKQLPEEFTVCVSTDDPEIANCANQGGFPVPFMRPAHLATDEAGTYEVLLHALDFYPIGKFDCLLLLQPTSPFRHLRQVQEALKLFAAKRPELVVSVTLSQANPYYNLFEEDDTGRLKKSKSSSFTRRQDCPPVYQYNGAIYVIDVSTLRSKPLHEMTDIRKVVMDEESSLDLDTPLDWELAELLLRK